MKVSKGVDMMDFWRDNRTVPSKMFSLARRILCIPASPAGSERVFGAAGRLLEKRRTNLAPDSVNSLLFLHICDISLYVDDSMTLTVGYSEMRF